MAADFRKVDEHGFTIPPSFGELPNHVDDASQPRKPVSVRTKRIVLGLLVLGILISIFAPKIISAGRESLAEWLSTRAARKVWEGDYNGALADLNQALSWNPDAWEPYLLRGTAKQKMNDLPGSLDDYSKLIDLLEAQDDIRNRHRRPLDRSSLLANAYELRSWVYIRMGRGREAIDDATRCVQFEPSPSHLNTRAYTRALANDQLKEGLADVEKALAGSNRDNADLLDTRGYLLYLLDRNEEALKDLDSAIKTTEQYTRDFMFRNDPSDPRSLKARRKEFTESLAVMHHHRGLVYEKLGQKDLAARENRRAEELGYNPANGVL